MGPSRQRALVRSCTVAVVAAGEEAYLQISSGTCEDAGYFPIQSESQCDAAASALALSDSVADPGDWSFSGYPSGCYFKLSEGTLWFNLDSSGVAAEADRQVLCTSDPAPCWDVGQRVRILPGSRYHGQAGGACATVTEKSCEGDGQYVWYSFDNGFLHNYKYHDLTMCKEDCDVTDASAKSSSYPCLCGSSTCSRDQYCDILANTCRAAHVLCGDGKYHLDCERCGAQPADCDSIDCEVVNGACATKVPLPATPGVREETPSPKEAVEGIADMECWEKTVTYEPLDMMYASVTKEPTPLACQERCRSTPECFHFSYWALGKDCHLQDLFALRQTGRTGFVAGPRRCYRDDEEMLRHGMARLQSQGVGDYTFVPIEFACLEVSTMYAPFNHLQATSFNVTPANQDPQEALRRCQQMCRITEGCAHWTVGAPGLQCELSGANAHRQFPMFKHVSGPPQSCTELLQLSDNESTTLTFTSTTHETEVESVELGVSWWGVPWWLPFAAGICLFAALAGLVAMAMRSSKGSQRREKRSHGLEFEQDEDEDDEDEEEEQEYFVDHYEVEERTAEPSRPQATSMPRPALPAPQPLRALAPGPLRPMFSMMNQQWSPWTPQRQVQYLSVPTSDSWFDALDRNHDGVIDRSEFYQAMGTSPPVSRGASGAFLASSPRGDPTATVQVTGPDLDGDGIPDILQQGAGPLARALSATARPGRPLTSPLTLTTAVAPQPAARPLPARQVSAAWPAYGFRR